MIFFINRISKKYIQAETEHYFKNYKCLLSNYEFEDFDYFRSYTKGLKSAVKRGDWKKYLHNKMYPKLYYKHPDSESYSNSREYFSKAYLWRIDICNIKGFYIGSKKNIFDGNLYRVSNAIDEILKCDHAPIEVERQFDTETYYLTDGRHRLNAHILLGKRFVFALVTDVSSVPRELFYSERDFMVMDGFRNADENIKDEICELLELWD